MSFSQDCSDNSSESEICVKPQSHKIDRELFCALTGISTQDSLNYDSDPDEVCTKEKCNESQASLDQMMHCFDNLQRCIQTVSTLDQQFEQMTPICESYEERRRQYYSQFEKVITIETTDPILYGICNIDRYGGLDQDEEKIQVKSLDLQQEFMKAKLKGEYPDPTNGGKSKAEFKIANLEKAGFWKSKCFCKIKERQIILQNRSVEILKIECKICDNKGNIGPEHIHKILKDNLGSRVTSLEWDKSWTHNMYGQVVWKLACYNQFFKIQSLTIFNILHNMAQKLMKEFLEIRKSFFQKAVVKEIPTGAHCVLMITNIRKSQNKNNPKSYLVDLSDGSYMLTAFVNENEKRFNCDMELINQINNRQVQVGEKYHFFGLYKNDNELFGKDKSHRINTEHYFLQNQHSMYLKINMNGMIRAHNSERMGEQPFPFYRVPLTNIHQYSKQICCMDVIVIKKTAQYFLEESTVFDAHESTNRRKRILRSKKAMERIRFLRQEMMEGNLQKDYENMFFNLQKQKDQEQALAEMQEQTEAMKEKMEDMKREKLDCFKLCFRIKVTDSIYYERVKQKEQEYKTSSRYDSQNPSDYFQTQDYKDEIKQIKEEIEKSRTYIISFIKSSQEVYDQIQDGTRIRLYNMKPDGTISMQGNRFLNEQCVFLQFQNGRSKFEIIADKLREKSGSFVPSNVKAYIQEMKDFGKELVIQPLKPQNYLSNLIEITKRKDEEQIMNYKKCNEMTFIGYIVKISYQPNPEGPNHPDSVNQVILLSAQGDIICVQVHDPHFFIKNAFPGEYQRVVMDHIAFLKMSRVNIKTRDNDLIEDKKMKDIIVDYHRSVLCTDCKPSPSKAFPNKQDFKLPDNFYYLMCQTNNNTQIETEGNRHMIEFRADCMEMSRFLDSERFQLRIRQIQMIIGERQTIEKSSLSPSKNDSNGSGPISGYRTFGQDIKGGRKQGYNYLNPNFLNMNSNLYGQTQMVGGKQGKDILISHGLIQDELSPQKADTAQIKSSTNFNFKSKYAKNGFNDILKLKMNRQAKGLKESIGNSSKFNPMIENCQKKPLPVKVQEALEKITPSKSKISAQLEIDEEMPNTTNQVQGQDPNQRMEDAESSEELDEVEKPTLSNVPEQTPPKPSESSSKIQSAQNEQVFHQEQNIEQKQNDQQESSAEELDEMDENEIQQSKSSDLQEPLPKKKKSAAKRHRKYVDDISPVSKKSKSKTPKRISENTLQQIEEFEKKTFFDKCVKQKADDQNKSSIFDPKPMEFSSIKYYEETLSKAPESTSQVDDNEMEEEPGKSVMEKQIEDTLAGYDQISSSIMFQQSLFQTPKNIMEDASNTVSPDGFVYKRNEQRNELDNIECELSNLSSGLGSAMDSANVENLVKLTLNQGKSEEKKKSKSNIFEDIKRIEDKL